MIKGDKAQGLDEEWIRITEQNGSPDKRGHKGDVDEMRVATCHRGPRLSRIDSVKAAAVKAAAVKAAAVKAAAVKAAAVRRRADEERITTSSCTDRFLN